MPKLSADAIKARIDQLQKQLAAAQSNKVPAIKKVKALMKKLGVTVTDLADGSAPAARRGRPPKAAKAKGTASGSNGSKPKKSGGKVAIKYRDDKGNTWTGRGKPARWLVDAEKGGTKRDSFLVK